MLLSITKPNRQNQKKFFPKNLILIIRKYRFSFRILDFGVCVGRFWREWTCPFQRSSDYRLKIVEIIIFNLIVSRFSICLKLIIFYNRSEKIIFFKTNLKNRTNCQVEISHLYRRRFISADNGDICGGLMLGRNFLRPWLWHTWFCRLKIF